MLDHASAGSRGRYNIGVFSEALDNLFGEGARISEGACVVGGLPTAGLLQWHLHPAAGMLQQFNRAEGDRWSQKICQAGDEEADDGLMSF
jgi:hypothetical protein